jgi:alkanesulfonate monooxygenase SsuD/methylene tetrahydromethanopterin reductase-like flavin-dependent oxidoreductase (luciferase family)
MRALAAADAVIYQAGTSPKGRDFAARHAECVFVSGPPSS